MSGSVADVAIIGAGAAGLATAIFAARRDNRRRILLLDGAKKLGAKVLISGGGRCNVTNDIVTADDYWGGSRNVVRRVLAALPAAKTVEFFRELGVSLHVEPGGKIFPDSNRARTVLDALVAEARRVGVAILTEHRVAAVRRDADGFELDTSCGALRAWSIVLATGGRSVPKTGSDGAGYRLAESLGHTLVTQTPALAPLLLDGDFHVALAGVSQEVELTIMSGAAKPVRLSGAMLWTHFGVSGPVAMNASRHWHAAQLRGGPATVTASFLPGDDPAAADRRLIDLAATQPRVRLGNAIASLVPARVAAALLARLSIDSAQAVGQLSRDTRRRLARALLEWPLPVRDSRGFDYAEVTAGGVPLDEIDPATMQSRKCAGLFLVGEILDVDGRIGGFNFQWAWSSAAVAAHGLSTPQSRCLQPTGR
jgi:predicted Rossmann fold flavoprotein